MQAWDPEFVEHVVASLFVHRRDGNPTRAEVFTKFEVCPRNLVTRCGFANSVPQARVKRAKHFCTWTGARVPGVTVWEGG